ncbi:MAG: Holliday junction resolvase RuvX [Bacteroidia bacterium]|nr:Holliday junction resolvase RuvX [Bacteroidia bacterium]
MSRILSIDYGTVRVGVAVTDPLQLIATGLTTVPANQIFKFLTDYMAKEPVESIIVGEPRNLSNGFDPVVAPTLAFIDKLKELFPSIPVITVDERFTSRMASRAMIDGGLKKMKRRDKAMIDKISATIILQTYMEMRTAKNAGRS